METYTNDTKQLETSRRLAEVEAVEKLEDAFRVLNRMNHRGTQVNITSSELIDLKRVLEKFQRLVGPE